MSIAMSSPYAHLPTFSEVIDGLASGLGLARNTEDALAGLNSFGRRILAYNGSSDRSGLQERLVELLAGPNETLKTLLRERLLDVESELTNARACPLVTEAKEAEGLRRFIEVWVTSWIAQLVIDSRQYPTSMLDSARLLLEEHSASLSGDCATYLTTWKTAVRRAIPNNANAHEFRSTLARLDQRSQRKHSSIEEDLAKLRVEMKSVAHSLQEVDAAVGKVRALYLAGMATMRLCAMADKIIPEQELITSLIDKLHVARNNNDELLATQQKRFYRYWSYLDPSFALSKKYDLLCAQLNRVDNVNFEKLLADSRIHAPPNLLTFVIDYAEGRWHLHQGRNVLAEQCLQNVVARADCQQLGEIAADAASILIAMRLAGPDPIKFEALNRLLRVRIDNMPQSIEMNIGYTPTPFSDWSPRPTPSLYDLHLMQCASYFNRISCASSTYAVCNPLQRFDSSLEDLIAQSRRTGAKLTETARKRSAIVGTSVKPYQVLRDHLYYRNSLFGTCLSQLPGMDLYAMLPQPDQLRLLRFIDPEEFKNDLEAHGISEWQHPDDVP